MYLNISEEKLKELQSAIRVGDYVCPMKYSYIFNRVELYGRPLKIVDSFYDEVWETTIFNCILFSAGNVVKSAKSVFPLVSKEIMAQGPEAVALHVAMCYGITDESTDQLIRLTESFYKENESGT